MLRAHSIRNECFHYGLMHEQILWSVAYEYHELACILFARYSPGVFLLTPQGPVSDAFEKHCPNASDLTSDNKLEQVAISLRSVRPEKKEMLGYVLAKSAKIEIDSIESDLQFLAQDGYKTEDIDEVIRLTLFFQTVDHDSLKSGLDMQDPNGVCKWNKRLEEAKTAYTTTISLESIRRWHKRALSLKKISDTSEALVKYTDLQRDYLESKEQISEAAYALDRHIQLETDIARGK